MPYAELVFGNVLDVRVRAAEGDRAKATVYTAAPGALSMPFAIVRDWRGSAEVAPTGAMVIDEVALIGPSGERVHLTGAISTFLPVDGSLVHLETVVEDAVFPELGNHLAAFLLEGKVAAEIPFSVALQGAAPNPMAPYEEGLKRSDVIFVGLEQDRDGRSHTVPAWFAYKNGRVLVLSSLRRGPDEQAVPGIPGAERVLVVTRRKGRDTALRRFRASVRVLEGEEWEEAAKILADRRRSRVGSPLDRIERWRTTCAIAELVPVAGA